VGVGLGASQWVYLRLIITDPDLTLERDVGAFLKGTKHSLDLSKAPSEGNPNAPVTIVEFGDLECPTCRSAYWLYKAVLREYGEQVRICFKHYPLDQKCNRFVGNTPHANACLAAKASVHAHQQGKFWEFAEGLYGGEKSPSQEACEAAARAIGLDPGAMMAFVKPRDSGWETIVADIEEGRKAGVTSTPAFFINGRRAEGVLVPRALRAFIDATLQEERSR
jgi:protein-disulfide isomerase